jgi:hypothetical protein
MPSEEFWDVEPTTRPGFITFEMLVGASPQLVHLVVDGKRFQILDVETSRYALKIQEIL